MGVGLAVVLPEALLEPPGEFPARLGPGEFPLPRGELGDNDEVVVDALETADIVKEGE